MRTRRRGLTVAWVEYQEPGDGAAFTHVCTSRLGFRNAFADLPRAGPSSTTRVASNASDSKFVVRTFQDHGKKPMRGLLAEPHHNDQEVFEKWIANPAIADGKLVTDPKAPTQVDLLIVSGHGSGGDVWGDEPSGDPTVFATRTRASPPHVFREHDDRVRSGRLKCLIVASCNNLKAELAPLWLSAFKHPQPVHVVLGYEDSYSGGSVGGRVLAKFAELLVRKRKMPLIEAWRHANESIARTQPWAAFAALAGEGLNLHDWLRNDLPPLSNAGQLLHFNAEHPQGEEARLVDKNYEVRWVMSDAPETVIDMSNNLPGNGHIGLFIGKPGKIRLRAKRASRRFKKGQELYLFIYRYRPSREIEITDLLAFDEALLQPHSNTGEPVVTLEKGRIQLGVRPRAPGVPPTTDAVKIVVPFDTDVLELRFTVPDSAATFDKDGPDGTFGRFLLDFIHDPVVMLENGNTVVVPGGDGNSYAAADGALLRE